METSHSSELSNDMVIFLAATGMTLGDAVCTV